MAGSGTPEGATAGGWSGVSRTAAARVADYDWDGSVAAASTEIAEAIVGHEGEIARAFWEYYLSLPQTAHIRGFFTPDYLS
ncbi:chemotaxis protein, partial [Pseudomonas sp. FW305-130]